MLVRSGFLFLFTFAILFADQSGPQPAPFNIAEKVKAISAKYGNGKSYLYEGEMTIDGQKGNGPVTLLRKSRFKVAGGDGGKSFYEMRTEGEDEFQTISNGQKTWIYLPGKKQYTAEESASAGSTEDEEEEEGGDLADHYARLVLPALKELASSTRAAGFYGLTSMKIDGNKGKWPIVRLELRAKENGEQPVIELVFDPDTLAIGRMTYADVREHEGERRFTRAIIRFDRFLSHDVPVETFTFDPPKNAKLVETIAVPGQSGILVGRIAPDFELKTLEGEKVHLSSLRGQPVLLSFWASWCPPCREELPVLQKLSGEYKGKGLRIFGVNDEGKSDAKHYAAKSDITFPTLDDGEQKLHRLYGVRSIPTVFLLDREGKVVKLLHGGHPEESFREALKALGL